MAELVFFSGTMDCGKSTLALQMDYNHSARGRGGILFSRNDRAGDSMISSRLGLRTPAVEVTDSTDFWDEVTDRRRAGAAVDYLICDEAQFYSADQVEQLARVVDELCVDVFAFGITSDFRTRLFPGSARLIELADRMEVLQVRALCWCGRRATHNARTVNGVMVVEGDQVVVGDVGKHAPAAGTVDSAAAAPAEEPLFAAEAVAPVVGYETLCRRHYMRRVTAHKAETIDGQMPGSATDLDVCAVHPRTL
ncbi:thymidine kinase [Arthrobacter sp. zg-ZUI100]|uniref:thymidine kinase n=1 Tax=Arthrobacter jiangjiafuii TaxID=2817475 RepID=UPI001AEE9F5A|nr:thymidine kinase [Arthrobacter jiangjiafuii]MBP3036786.1 thymidine kinase [Arthrobacter jiangjiafuii]